ncbi:response regulator [Virgibacillus sp. MSP4-1]|uniref:response regulator n=1 Tax=Virgibacillus sp. MSP4-1 TaxID=2700081 RepID=UPI0005C4862B|nr:response regulator [Virgibacillus sp. MSP4-1]QHS21831.1 response regulator [Virgibacillus sp. MSP4-1]
MSVILLADDSAFMRNWLKQIIQQHGPHEFVEAKDGQEAVTVFQAVHPDMVIMDMVMPVKNGLETLSEIMSVDSTAKVIICSSLGTESNVMDAIQAGAKDFVVKPYFKNLGDIVAKHLN